LARLFVIYFVLLFFFFYRTALALEPANPNAMLEARQVLNYLDSLDKKTSNKIISGQHVGSSSFYQNYNPLVRDIYNETGKWLALIGVDFGWIDPNHATDWPDAKPLIIDHWNKKGLITISWHVANPAGGGAVNMAQLITPGTSLNSTWMGQLKQKADWLAELRDEKVVVLWRPFHEMNLMRNSHWWCEASQKDFINVWKHMFDYFTKTRGLNNLLWVYAPGAVGGTLTDYYPGNEYVDIVGVDIYVKGNPLSSLPQMGYSQLLALGKPFALTECGPGTGSTPPSINSYDYHNLINNIKSYCPEAVYFMAWNENYAIANQLNASGLLNDSWIINRDEVDWRSVVTPTLKPTATQTPRFSFTPTSIMSSHFCKTCDANVPQFSLGNANCDSDIDILDFYLLRNVLIKLQNDENVTETEKAAVDFDCQIGQTTHTVDLKDFNIWAGNYKETF